MKVRIRQDHIENGKCKAPRNCMIAAAIRDADPTISYVSVRTNGITITKRKADGGGGVRQHWTVPLKAARAIILFDQGQDVSPFSFKPKMVDEKVIPEVSASQRSADAARTQKRRAAMKRLGLKEQRYGRASRIAGV